MSQITEEECLVRDWLQKLGYEAEFEAGIVTSGGRPDFLATAKIDATPAVLWVEVKSIDADKNWSALSEIRTRLGKRPLPDGLHGSAVLHPGGCMREDSAIAVLKKFCQEAKNYAAERTSLIFVQQCTAGTDWRRFEVQGDVTQRIWVRGTGNSPIALPPRAIEDLYARVTTWDAKGCGKAQHAFEVFDQTLLFDCALAARLDPAAEPLRLTAFSVGSSTLPFRFISGALQKANLQIRNACDFRQAPGLAVIVPKEIHFDDFMIKVAALGLDYHARSGVFGKGKNTHISAVVHLRRDGSAATYFANPFAQLPIRHGSSLLAALAGIRN